MITDNINSYLESVATSCGVYVMKAENDDPLYIGKAKNLRNRLRSYFRPSGLSHRIEVVMQQVVHIETIVTRTETEALLLENNLIKSSKPRYNINLRDDKSYPYIRIDDSHDFPKLEFYRGSCKEPGRYFGPFSSASAVRETLSQIQKVFPVRQCRDTFFRHRSRPCLQYQIERCTAPCVGLVNREAYLDDVEQVARFLMGKNQDLNNLLIEKMEKAASELDFETAAKYRDRISSIQKLREIQTVEGGSTDLDVIAIEESGGILCIQLLIFRSGRNIDFRTYFPKIGLSIDLKEALSEFIPRYYLEREIPPKIIVDREVTNKSLLCQALSESSGRRVEIRRPLRGAKVRMVEMAMRNARDAIRRRLGYIESMEQRVAALVELFKMEDTPSRIECFDVSHTQGEKTVASCVVFDHSGPVKSEYRRFNVSNIVGGDDYAALRDALTRRYCKLKIGEGKLPDLILIDGGKNQLNVALDVMNELQIAEVIVAAISKGKERRAGHEKIWITESDKPIICPLNALLLLQQIRDEAHRFAIVGHRTQRGKASKKSVLESIPGIGQRRRTHLLKHFGGLQGVSKAGVEELQKVPSISAVLAVKIYQAFHQSD